jgi:hypothetical protein
MKITLTEGEYAKCVRDGTDRWLINRIKSNPKSSIVKPGIIDNEVIGLMAEMAFSKWKNIPMPADILNFEGSCDFVIGNFRIDIKATNNKGGHLIAPTSTKLEKATVYLLAIVDGLTVDFVGWALASELLHKDNIVQLQTPAYRIMRSDLRRFKEEVAV